MGFDISISSTAEHRLHQRADEAGIAPEILAARMLEAQLMKPSIDEVLAPLRSEVAASGMSEDELGNLLERAKHELRAGAKRKSA